MTSAGPHHRVRWTLMAGFLLSSTIGVALQQRIIALEASGQHPYRLMYLPAKEYVKPASLGYDHVAADFLFLRAIQAFGATYAQSLDLGQLWAYFDTVTDLDPHFLAPYTFGNLVLGEMANDAERGLAILDKGIRNNPDQYKPAYDSAFYAFWGLDNIDLARKYVTTALGTPDCPDFVRRWEAFLDEKLGRYEAAFQKFLTEYIDAVNGGDSTLVGIQEKRLRQSIDQWYARELRDKALAFMDREGRYPSVAELEAGGAFLDTAWPDWPRLDGFLQALSEGRLVFDGTEETTAELAEQFIRTGWERMPPSPMSLNSHYPGYLVWPDMPPSLPDGSDNSRFAINEFEAAYLLKEYFKASEGLIFRYRSRNDGECPPDLATAFPIPEGMRDPFGGEFVYDPETCRVDVTSRPHLREEVGTDKPLR